LGLIAPVHLQAKMGQSTPIHQILGAGKWPIFLKFGQWIHIIMNHWFPRFF
jgi:hypothetical protein